MPGTTYQLEINPRLPQRLSRLEELANDLWYSWDRPTRTLFSRLHPELWHAIGHSPKAFLKRINQQRLTAAADDPVFLGSYNRVLSAFDSYHSHGPRGGHAAGLEQGDLIAYFCAEFGFHESLPIYSGGLGILAGDHCKAASDLALPFVGVGLLYRQGYFSQTIDNEGRQHALYTDSDFDDLPITPVVRDGGGELHVTIDMPQRSVAAKVWQAQVGKVRLFLLDTDIEKNSAADRNIAHQLYGGDRTMRIEQEIVLGVGGVRALNEMGLKPTVWHINEGHAAFLTLERMRQLTAGPRFRERAGGGGGQHRVHHAHRGAGRARPFQRGNDPALLRRLVPRPQDQLRRVDRARARPVQPRVQHDRAGGARLALPERREPHPRRRVLAHLRPAVAADRAPRQSADLRHQRRACADFSVRRMARAVRAPARPGWSQRLADEDCQRGINAIPDHLFWSVHQSLKAQMLHLVRFRISHQHLRNHGSQAHLDRMLKLADPNNPNVLTIGFARRFATYKRATLLFENLDLLREIVSDSKRPVLFLFAGKAHPADQPGQDFLRRVAEVARLPEFEGHILLIEGYDLQLARRLVSGVDVWLNNPIYPLEACGTSGMKAGMNGVLNLSVLDGWWGEGYDGKNGWAIKPASATLDEARRNQEEARTLYEILQDSVVPLYYDIGPAGYSPGWMAMAKHSMASILPRFNSTRMLGEYLAKSYQPAAQQWRRYSQSDYAGARAVASWKAKVRAAWQNIALRRIDSPRRRIPFGENLRLEVAVNLNGLTPDDVVVQLLFGRPGDGGQPQNAQSYDFKDEGQIAGSSEHLYVLEFTPDLCGKIEYRIRVYPYHELLTHRFEMGMMTWL